MKAIKICSGSKLSGFTGRPGLRHIIYGLSVLLLLILFLTASCATHGKHGRIKAVPCPCETRNRR